jgi:hypothetical protein
MDTDSDATGRGHAAAPSASRHPHAARTGGNAWTRSDPDRDRYAARDGGANRYGYCHAFRLCDHSVYPDADSDVHASAERHPDSQSHARDDFNSHSYADRHVNSNTDGHGDQHRDAPRDVNRYANACGKLHAPTDADRYSRADAE